MNEVKKNLLVSFSGGETSAYMAQWLHNNKQDEFNMVFVFANTGQENEETLYFVKKFSEYFEIKIYWVEALVYHNERKSSGHQFTSYENASRNGEPFEEIIKKYGIPNQSFPHCTREIKLNPITSFAKNYFLGEKYYTAIGIRSDEADRISKNAYKNNLIYPLISKKYIPMTKPKINFWWKNQPFRLKLKGYQGNCKTCWKKSDKKLFKIANENQKNFDFMKRMEEKYPRVGAEFKKDPNCVDRVFFRGNRSSLDILNQSKGFNKSIIDDSDIYENDLVGGEQCEIWAECG